MSRRKTKPNTRAATAIKTRADRQPGATAEPATSDPVGAEGNIVAPCFHRAGLLPPAGERFSNKTKPACQPIPLTISGPSRVATASGKRFHAAIKTASFGLSGFKSGIERPRARRNW